MNKKTKPTRFIAEAAVIAALYAALTCFLAPISYGSVQFRVSEALTILPVLTPAAIPGLTIGCLIANFSSPFGIVDVVLGTLATFLASICTMATRNIRFKNLPLLSAFFPVLFNAVIVGLDILIAVPDAPHGFSFSDFTFKAYLINMLTVGLGEIVVCYLLGVPLCKALEKTKLFPNSQK
ncbi:MAG: QueT transporter family protein [Clostridia bacterium]|nr:QueT transporter family protein [Clostridia bacterium]